MSSAWDVPIGTGNYGHLPANKLCDWASDQASLSEAYARTGKGVSASVFGRSAKRIMLARIRDALLKRSVLSHSEIANRLIEVSDHLEDPGLLKNFQYFDVPSSDFMLQFYFAVWDRRIAEVMGYLHNYGKDLMGVPRFVNTDDIWYHMSYYEGMNINERKKAQAIADFIKSNRIQRATSFGGGNIPERLYGLPSDLKLTVFDDGPVSPLEELFPDAKARSNVQYIKEKLSRAFDHQDLLGTQGLVWMDGVSMYLDEAKRSEMTSAILCSMALLRPDGYMKYDYLVNNESMRRVVRTQNWPYDPARPMTTFDDVTTAIQQGRKTVAEVNHRLAGRTYVEIHDPEITLTEPWGVTSVRFTLQKHV